MDLSDISVDQMAKLTRILYHQLGETSDGYQTRIKAEIPALSAQLRRPKKVVRVFQKVMRLFRHSSAQNTNDAPLCQSHSQLNCEALAFLLDLVKLETSQRLREIVEAGQEQITLELSETVISPLVALRRLWTPADTISSLNCSVTPPTASEMSPNDHHQPVYEDLLAGRWDYRTNKCAACILSEIVAHPKTILALRCALKSRETALYRLQYGDPRLKPWVEAWLRHVMERQRIDNADEVQKLAIHFALSASESRTEQLMELRKSRKNVEKEVGRSIEQSQNSLVVKDQTTKAAQNAVVPIHSYNNKDAFKFGAASDRRPASRVIPTNDDSDTFPNNTVPVLADSYDTPTVDLPGDSRYAESQYSIDTLRGIERAIMGVNRRNGVVVYGLPREECKVLKDHEEGALQNEVVLDVIEESREVETSSDKEFGYLDDTQPEAADFEVIMMVISARDHQNHRDRPATGSSWESIVGDTQGSTLVEEDEALPMLILTESVNKSLLPELTFKQDSLRWSDVYKYVE